MPPEATRRLQKRGLEHGGPRISSLGPTAYSSTEQLAPVPSTELMLGASFVTDCARDARTASIESSRGVARRLRLNSVAVGVE